jgi:thiol-disulfide isomerase/thioredoxin
LSARWLFAGVALAAAAAGTAFWLAMRPSAPSGAAATAPGPVRIAPSALFAATFTDAAGTRQSLGQYEGKVLVLNFWATWCAPCREEMPAFVRLQSRWADRGVQFLGLANEDPAKVHGFGRELGVNYPLWTGGDEVSELSRRLGNRLGVLPHTAIVGSKGEVLDVRVGPYTEAEMEERLAAFARKTP